MNQSYVIWIFVYVQSLMDYSYVRWIFVYVQSLMNYSYVRWIFVYVQSLMNYSVHEMNMEPWSMCIVWWTWNLGQCVLSDEHGTLVNVYCLMNMEPWSMCIVWWIWNLGQCVLSDEHGTLVNVYCLMNITPLVFWVKKFWTIIIALPYLLMDRDKIKVIVFLYN